MKIFEKMDNHQKFLDSVKKAADSFKKIDKSQTVRIVSHLDCDGICASSILIKALSRENIPYSISIVQQLNETVLKELSGEDYNYYLFTDLGSGALSKISEYLGDKVVYVLDHHELDKTAKPTDNIIHVNPHQFGIDGSREISGSGVVFLFARAINKENEDMAHIAIIGAIGDVQERSGFMALNEDILKLAKKKGKMNVSKGIRLFGSQTRPLHKALEFSSDPYIPGVTGSESAAIQFLQSIGINPKHGKYWKKMMHLTEDEKKKLAGAIIMKRMKEESPEDIFGFCYLLTDEKDESPLKDAREYSTLLNACGRLNKSSLGIGTCLGNEKTKQKAISHLTKYKQQIVSALNWYRDNKDNSDFITKGDGFIIINAKDNVLSTIIGTLASIISKSGEIEDNVYVMSLAYATEEKNIKVSLRIAGMRPNKAVDLQKIVLDIVKAIGAGEAGGHMQAAGAVIPLEKEYDFIDAATRILKKTCMEEDVS